MKYVKKEAAAEIVSPKSGEYMKKQSSHYVCKGFVIETLGTSTTHKRDKTLY